MSTYSLGGYKIAVLARSRKTVVVEGRTDRVIVKRLFLEVADNDPSFDTPLVDTPELVKDAALTGLGNRDRVKSIAAAVGDPVKLIGFIDREWDGFCLNTLVANTEDFILPVLMTKGHSVENYFFDVDICLDFIRTQYADLVSAELLALIREQFGEAISFAFAYSIIVGRKQLLSRAISLLSLDDIEYDGTDFRIGRSVVEKLKVRGGDEESLATFLEEFEVLRQQLLAAEVVDVQRRRWLSHGHLGDEAIWACIGKLALSKGLKASDARMIASGNRDFRLRCAAHVLVRNYVNQSPPLSMIVDWVGNRRSA